MSHSSQYRASSQSEMESQPLLGAEDQSRLSNDPQQEHQQDSQRVWRFIKEDTVDKLLSEINDPTMGELKESFHDFDTSLVELETEMKNPPKYYYMPRKYTQDKLESMKKHAPKNVRDLGKSLNNKIEVVTEKLQSEYKNLTHLQRAEKAFTLMSEFQSEIQAHVKRYDDLTTQAWKEASTHAKLLFRFISLVFKLGQLAKKN